MQKITFKFTKSFPFLAKYNRGYYRVEENIKILIESIRNKFLEIPIECNSTPKCDMSLNLHSFINSEEYQFTKEELVIITEIMEYKIVFYIKEITLFKTHLELLLD